MKKSLLVAASALLFSVGAANIGNPKLEYHEDLIAGMVDWEDLEPRPARGNYPACRRHRGDDRCIQLYERGVREALASWDQPTGGWSGDSRLARFQRGPHQEMAEADHHDDDPIADDDEPEALGGPVERRTDYPPCSGDEDDDRCIQLYERAVSGERTRTPGI